MEIDRLWGQPPGWSSSLPREEIERMLAWYEVAHAKPPAKNNRPVRGRP